METSGEISGRERLGATSGDLGITKRAQGAAEIFCDLE